jgi:hypothetical protein
MTRARACGLVADLDPRRCMVARVRQAADVAIDARGNEPLRDGFAEKKMVESHAGVVAPRVSHVILERVHGLVRVQLAQRIGPA